MKIIKKQLATLGAFLVMNTASNAMFDLEFKIALEPYTFASENFASEGQLKETFKSDYNLSQSFQNFGVSVQGEYNILERLYIGLGLGAHYDRSFTGTRNVRIDYKDRDGNSSNSFVDKKGKALKIANGMISDYHIEQKGAFFNFPISALVKYDIPIDLESYPMNTYVIAKGGVNFCLSNENNNENKAFSSKPFGFIYGIGGGLEIYGMQLELLFNGIVNGFIAKDIKDDHTQAITFGSMKKTNIINKTYSRMGFSASIGYRLPLI